MGNYINIKCVKCGKSFTGGYINANYSKLGFEEVKCFFCGSVNLTGQKRYSKFSVIDKLMFWGMDILRSIIYGGCGLQIPFVILGGEDFLENDNGGFSFFAVSLFIIGSLLFFIYKIKANCKDINEIEQSVVKKNKRHLN